MKTRRTILFLLGVLCLLGALGLTVWNLWSGQHAKQAADAALRQLEPEIPAAAQQEPSSQAAEPQMQPQEQVVIPDYLLNPDMEMPVEVVDGVAYVGILEIPALELTLPVTGDWSYEQLRIAACRYAGSAYQNDMVVMAHNYPAFFKDLNRLRQGDEIRFTDMDGNIFTYTAADFEQLRPEQVEDMTMAADDWDLTLFTCTVGGQLRIAVRCLLTEPASAQ